MPARGRAQRGRIRWNEVDLGPAAGGEPRQCQQVHPALPESAEQARCLPGALRRVQIEVLRDVEGLVHSVTAGRDAVADGRVL